MMRFYIFICITFLSFVSFSQANLSNYPSERETLYLQNKDYISTDKDYVQEYGEVLPALVKKEVNGDLVVFTYKTFRNINEKNQQNVLNRLKTVLPSIVNISNQGNEIKVSFLNPEPEHDLIELLRLTGYKGYQIITN